MKSASSCASWRAAAHSIERRRAVTSPAPIQTGSTLRIGNDQSYEIVGLVADAKAIELRDAPYPTIYLNMF
ncbi:MAG: hypothetical protein WBY44_28935 [Bryobacteraceae bacterium]